MCVWRRQWLLGMDFVRSVGRSFASFRTMLCACETLVQCSYSTTSSRLVVKCTSELIAFHYCLIRGSCPVSCHWEITGNLESIVAFFLVARRFSSSVGTPNRSVRVLYSMYDKILSVYPNPNRKLRTPVLFDGNVPTTSCHDSLLQ